LKASEIAAHGLTRSLPPAPTQQQEYIARLQRDLSSLGHRKDAELKASKASLLSSGDIYAAMEKDEKGMQYPHGADARSKYVQKVLVMDKKHHSLFQLLKQVDERHKSGPENQMKQIVKTYRQLATVASLPSSHLTAISLDAMLGGDSDFFPSTLLSNFSLWTRGLTTWRL